MRNKQETNAKYKIRTIVQFINILKVGVLDNKLYRLTTIVLENQFQTSKW